MPQFQIPRFLHKKTQYESQDKTSPSEARNTIVIGPGEGGRNLDETHDKDFKIAIRIMLRALKKGYE